MSKGNESKDDPFVNFGLWLNSDAQKNERSSYGLFNGGDFFWVYYGISDSRIGALYLCISKRKK